MVELIKCKRNSNMSILSERSTSDEIFNDLHDSRVGGFHPDGRKWCKIGLINIPTCNVSKGVSLSLCIEISVKASFSIKKRDHHIQKVNIISKNYINVDDRKILGL